LPKLIVALVAAVLSVAPSGRAYAQSTVDPALIKACNQLSDLTRLEVSLPGGDYDQTIVQALQYRTAAYYYLRRVQLAKQAERDLALMEAILTDTNPKAKDALEQMRKLLRAEAEEAEKSANAAAAASGVLQSCVRRHPATQHYDFATASGSYPRGRRGDSAAGAARAARLRCSAWHLGMGSRQRDQRQPRHHNY